MKITYIFVSKKGKEPTCDVIKKKSYNLTHINKMLSVSKTQEG